VWRKPCATIISVCDWVYGEAACSPYRPACRTVQAFAKRNRSVGKYAYGTPGVSCLLAPLS